MTDLQDRLIGSLVGLAVGDAVGTTVEFKPRGSFPRHTDMTGGGPFRLQAGYWTDDTSMALCLAESLFFDPSLDPEDLLTRFCNWYNHGYNSPTGKCFDIGVTTVTALEKYMYNGSLKNNSGDHCAGNGSIMRLAPAAIMHHRDRAVSAKVSAAQSQTTHASDATIAACELLSEILINCYTATDKLAVLKVKMQNSWPAEVSNIIIENVKDKTESQIRATGYVIHTLEAAVWCFLNTDSFKDAIITAVNLGDDADTVGAVTGQLAGAYYGESGIPQEWKDKLYDYDKIRNIAIQLGQQTNSVISRH
jgi:ADP-ribosyl-[dinitrogen reductase] hydrolase